MALRGFFIRFFYAHCPMLMVILKYKCLRVFLLRPPRTPLKLIHSPWNEQTKFSNEMNETEHKHWNGCIWRNIGWFSIMFSRFFAAFANSALFSLSRIINITNAYILRNEEKIEKKHANLLWREWYIPLHLIFANSRILYSILVYKAFR